MTTTTDNNNSSSSNETLKPTRVLITGASGYLGQHLIHTLQRQQQQQQHLQDENNDKDGTNGIELYCLFRSMEGFHESVKDVPIVKDVSSLDLTDSKAVKDYFRDKAGTGSNDDNKTASSSFDVCIHLAAMSSPRKCHEDPQGARAANVPVAFLSALPKDILMVALSTDQVYDGTSAPYSNNALPNPVNVYGTTKLQMELYIKANFDRCVVLRSSILLGPDAPYCDKAHNTFVQFCKSRQGQHTTFYTDECRSVCGVKDATRVLQYFVRNHGQHHQTEVFNMGGPERVSRWDMATAVARHCGFDAEPHFEKALKADQPTGPMASPLDISMDSGELSKVTRVQMRPLSEVLEETFP